jgi:hypothetical protein
MNNKAEDVARFGCFVSSSRWRFANTYVESYPHEYTLARWGDAETFRASILCIERWGTRETFLTSRRKYLYVGDQKYWHMGAATSNNADKWPTLINRTWIDVSMYRGHAADLGYEGKVLEKLVVRWNMLLNRARNPR